MEAAIQEYLKQLLKASSIGYTLHEIFYEEKKPSSFCFLEVNGMAEQLLGFSEKELKNKSIDAFADHFQPVWTEWLDALALTEEPFFYRMYSHASQQYFSFMTLKISENLFACIYDASSDHYTVNPSGMSGNENLKLILSHAEASMFMLVKQQGRFVYEFVNEMYLRISERKKEDIIGHTPEQVYGSEAGYVIERMAQRCFESKMKVHYQPKILTPQGERLYIRTTLLPYYENGQVIGVIGTALDQTDYSKKSLELETALKGVGFDIWHLSAKQFYNRVANHLPIVVYPTINNLNVSAYNVDEFYHEDRANVIDRLTAFFSNAADTYDCEYRVQNDYGNWVWIHSIAYAVTRDHQNRPEDVIGIHVDITKEKAYLEELKQKEARFRSVVNNVSDMIVQINHRGEYAFVNAAFCDLVGKNKEALIGKKIFDDLHPGDCTKLSNLYGAEGRLRKGSAGKLDKLILGLKNQHNEYIITEWHGSLIDEAPGQNQVSFFAVGHDVTLRERERIAMEYRLNHDSLTGLVSRDRLYQLLKQHDPSIRAVGVFIDLDNFKTVNDFFGHEIGDIFLKATANAIQNISPEHSTVARLSGDEFYVFIPHYASKQSVIETVGEIIRSIGCITNSHINEHVHVNASAGLVFYPEHVNELEKIVSFSDMAMFQAKLQGKNQLKIYDKEDAKKYNKNFRLIHDLKVGIDQDEFEMYYQPVVCTSRKKAVEVEALMRWNHPKYGLLLPGDFIHVVEASGEIHSLSRRMFEQIVSQMSKWDKLTHEQISVAVNVSPVQLSHRDFSEVYLNILKEHSIAPERIRFEITESMILNQTEQTRTNIMELKRAGCLIALDDFGIEYSTLSKLDQIDFDILKIDRYFTQNLDSSAVNVAVVEMIRKIIDLLGKSCVVEGVETKEQAKAMREMGFFMMQGFYFARPMPGSAVAPYIEKLGPLLNL